MDKSTYILRDLRFSYGGNRSPFRFELDSLDIRSGDILALVGPNGAGKTTLLMLLAFLLKPTGGYLTFRGKELGTRDFLALETRRDIVFVTHHPYLFKGTVFDNLSFGLKVRNVPEVEWPPRISEALALVELPGWEAKSVAGLSAGQIQRVALARAIVLKPKVLLLDEPTANIDAGLGMRIEALIREVSRDAETTIVFSTHNFSQASRLADDILYLSGGKQVRFSHENCFSGYAQTDGRISWIEPRPGKKIIFPGTLEGHVTCVINPEHIRLLAARESLEDGPPNLFSGKITRMETTEGDIALVRISGDLSFRAILPVDALKDLEVFLSKLVLVRFSPDDVEIIHSPDIRGSS